MKVYINWCILGKIWEKFGSWHVLMFLANRIAGFSNELYISLERKDEKAWFFACWYKFIEIKSWLKNIGIGVVINGCAHSGCRNLKLAVSHKEINGINWFLVFDIKWGKLKVTLMIGPPSYRGSYKIMVVCLPFRVSVHPSISLAFSWGMAYYLSLIFGTKVNNWNI